VNGQDSQAEIFDVFLCHNSEDKPAVREIARELVGEGIKPWLDEEYIRPADYWTTAIGEQIKTVKSAAVFFGSHGVSPWQSREITALINESDRRRFPVVPVILASDTRPVVPWSLEGLQWVDFRATSSQPLRRLIWIITGEQPSGLAHVPPSEKPSTMQEAARGRLLPSGNDHVRVQKVSFGDRESSKARHSPPLAKAPDPEQATQLEILRRRVAEYWIDGVLRQSLHNEVLISLGMQQMDKAVNAPWKYTVEVSDAVNSASLEDKDINTIYSTTGLLLILGEPGSGKTTTLLDLARTLLDRARQDIKERVPIVLNLSSWEKNQSLAEWISSELSEKYWVPRKIAQSWLQNNYLLPLFDGLDEVETTLQPDCVTAINVFIQECNPSGLVVCSRLNEYRWLPERLKLNGAICLEPLGSEEVGKYLAAGGAKLAVLSEAIVSDAVLQEVAQTPLMLSIMSLACQGAETREFAVQEGDSVEERRKQIFRLYVKQMFQPKGRASLAFPKEKTIGWLSWLAQKMRQHSQSVFIVEALEPRWLDKRAEWAAYGTAAALSFGVIFALTCGLMGGLLGGALRVGLIDGLIVGLIGGLSIGVGAGLVHWWDSSPKNGWPILLIWTFPPLAVCMVFALIVAGSLNDITLVKTRSWKWNQFSKRAIRGSITGLIFGLASWLCAELFALLSASGSWLNEQLIIALGYWLYFC
jgi:hypothetical protein